MTVKAGELFDKKQRAVRLLQGGQLMEAMRLCQEICAEDDQDAGMLCMQGYIYGQLGQYDNSARLCSQALAINPEYLEGHYYLGSALRLLGRTEQAISAFEYVLSKWPDNVEARYELGLVLEWAGDFDGAVSAFRAVQKIKPDHRGAIAGEVTVYEKRGETDVAWKTLRPHVEGQEIDSGMMAVAYGRLALSTGRQNTAIARLEQALGLETLSGQEKEGLHYILGMLYDSKGDFDSAFSHYEEANRSKCASFDVQGFNSLIDAIIDRFSAEQLAKAPRSDCQSRRPVFVVGMMRSGTSLVEQILSSHTQIYGAGELPHIDRIAGSLAKAEPVITELACEQLNQQASLYLDRINELDRKAARVIDKMPQNFMHLGYISLLFPQARIIHCTRNALDTCLSCYFQNFSVVHTYTFDLEDLGHCYNGYRKLMKHWQGVLDIPVHEIRYESLITEPEREIAALLKSCGLDWESGCLDFHQNRRTVATASYGQVRRPLYSKSMGRWKNYEKHLGRLMEVLGYP